ncbi:hypothetical protein BDQ12DRAFT_663626 [Crucibulum laeve]|uniref:Uncharacterized protein n=1 Tax=Crucibulum laeve TaxID=68775 RepID=A0A5C3MAC0_9AGAR|nr:hypothetical protein BDQ12DRAFT_663626 [Crucibulum laeve]
MGLLESKVWVQWSCLSQGWRQHRPTGVKGAGCWHWCWCGDGSIGHVQVKDGGNVGLLVLKVQGVSIGVDMEIGPLVMFKLRVKADNGAELLLTSVLVLRWQWGHFGAFDEARVIMIPEPPAPPHLLKLSQNMASR